MARLPSGSSVMASITRSADASACGRSSDGRRRASTCSGSEASRWRWLARNASVPLIRSIACSSPDGRRPVRETVSPLWASRRAIPAPIVPAPTTTATCLMPNPPYGWTPVKARRIACACLPLPEVRRDSLRDQVDLLRVVGHWPEDQVLEAGLHEIGNPGVDPIDATEHVALLEVVVGAVGSHDPQERLP